MKRNRLFISFAVIYLLLTTTSFAHSSTLFYDGNNHDATGKAYSVRLNGTAVTTDVPAVLLYDKYPMIPQKAISVASPKPTATPVMLGSAVSFAPAPVKTPYTSPKQTNVAIPKKSPAVSPAVSPSVSPTLSPKATPTVLPSISPAPTPSVMPSVSPSPAPEKRSISDIFHYNYNGNEQIVIMTSNADKYNIIRQTDPDRLVIDFEGAVAQVAGSQTTKIQGSIVKKYQLEQLNSTTVRVSLDVNGMADYEVSEQSDRIIFFIKVSNLKNITYTNNKDRTCFNLKGAKLTQGDQYLKKLYREEYNQNGTTYIIAFPSNLASLNSGIIKLNDRYLNSVEINNDTIKAQTTITFYSKMKLIYNIIYRPETNDTAITILKPYALSEKLVVIDPGHGGYDPGAVNGNVYEKNLNIDIAVKLGKLLREKNINTYIIREDDSFVGLYERSYIANSLNASLFLSIHNNALGDPYFLGTMTLYTDENPYDKNLFGKRFAQIIQDNLTARLKSINRDIRNRPELVVLKAAKMPSALAEVGFMTNSYELSNLLRDNYRLAAAQALCDSVIKALGEIK